MEVTSSYKKGDAVQITNDGGEQSTLNGVCDWANEEENIKVRVLIGPSMSNSL